MTEGTKKVTTDLVLLVNTTGYYQEYENGAVSDLLQQQGQRPHLSMLLPGAVADRVIAAVQAAIAKGAVHVVGYSLVVAGKMEYFEAKAIPLQMQYALLLLQNITAHEENRKELQQRNTLLQTVIDSVPPEITAYDTSGKVTLINKAALKNNPPAGEVSDSDELYLKQDGATEIPETELPLVRAFNGEAVYNQIIIKKGESHFPKTYLVNAVPMRDEEGSMSGVVLAERDITDIKNIQHQLRTKIRDFDMFMYRASHDLKSPLSAMKGVLDFAAGKVSDPDMMTYLNMLRKSHNMLSTTVNDLISLTRISQKEVEKTKVCLQPFMQDIIDAMRLVPQAENIKVRLCAREQVSITTDEGLLRAVLQNLICNAIVHHHTTGDDRFVLVSVLEQPRSILIEVTDNGPGIPEEMHEKIYEIFYRANPRAGGSGLGLFIVKQAVEKLNGRIGLVSDGKSGATFSVVLPK